MQERELVGPDDVDEFCAAGKIRTFYPRLRRPVLYPDELQPLVKRGTRMPWHRADVKSVTQRANQPESYLVQPRARRSFPCTEDGAWRSTSTSRARRFRA